jgi:hypothetical protein
MLGAEERWVDDPARIYGRQTWPLLAHTDSFLTRIHDLHRLRWMLADPRDPKVTAAVAKALRGLAPAGGKLSRDDLGKLAQAIETAPRPLPAGKIATPYKAIHGLTGPARALIAQAGKDLRTMLSDIPDDALALDWAYLCKQMASDLEHGAAAALAALADVRRAVLTADNARAWLVGSTASDEALRAPLAELLAALPATAPPRVAYGARRFIDDRLRTRVPAAKAPLFVGLVNSSTSSGVFVNSAPGASHASRGEDELLDYLASNLYTGHGGHSIFSKTVAAGLAYSNGLRISVSDGRIRYYAERCPELPQTLKFVIDELRRATVDPSLVDYALAEAFASRVALSYEARARGIADDLTDGDTPDTVRAFRRRLLDLRGRPALADDLFGRMESVYGTVLPGYGPASATVGDAVFFVIGPHAQLDAWQRYLETAEGKDAVLYRLYPRDFWVTAAVK